MKKVAKKKFVPRIVEDLSTVPDDELKKMWSKYICPTCKVKGFTAHEPGCKEFATAKRHGVGPLDWAKACRVLSGWEGEEVRCVLPKGHGGIHQWPTTEAERAEQLKRGNLQSLIDEAKQERQLVNNMASKNVQSKTAAAGKTSKAAPVKAKGNAAALAKAHEATAGKRAEFRAQKIKLLVKENPKRPGSASFERYDLYKKAKTVGDFIDAGGKSADIAYDVKHEYIELA